MRLHISPTRFDADGKARGTLLCRPRRELPRCAVLNFIKLSLSAFRVRAAAGVITTSATAYAARTESVQSVYSLPQRWCVIIFLLLLLYFLILLCNLWKVDEHSSNWFVLFAPPFICHGATINGVSPAETITKLLPADLANKPILAAGAPVS